MEKEKNVKKVGKVKVLIRIFVTVITFSVIYFGFLKPQDNIDNPTIQKPTNTSESNNSDNMQGKLKDISYNIVVSEWKAPNSDAIGGFSTTYSATLVNTNKKEMYTIHYSDVWEVHEERGYKDNVTIEIHKLTDKKLTNIINKYTEQKVSTIEEFLDANIDTEYDVEITYQTIDNIKYDIILDKRVSNIEENMGNKTTDGVYSIEHYYELINTQLKKKYTVYCNDIAEIYNNEGEDDNIIVEVENITDEELAQISKDKISTLQNLYDLIKEHITEEFVISIVDTSLN